MGKKALFLFLGLGLPILVFIFLKLFGKNEFDVPFPDLRPSSECGVSISSPYIVPDTTLTHFTSRPFKLLILNFGPDSKRLDRIVSRPDVNFVNDTDSEMHEIRPSQLLFLRRCMLMMDQSFNLVLIDDKRVIRGVYDVADRDELDRLEAEVKILLKEY